VSAELARSASGAAYPVAVAAYFTATAIGADKSDASRASPAALEAHTIGGHGRQPDMGSESRISRAGGDELVAALARVRPARVFVVVEGESPREVACGQPRSSGRWRRVARLARDIAGDDSAQLELRDGKNTVLERLELTDPPDDDDTNASAVGSLDSRDERILTLVVSAQRAALEEQRVLLGPVLAAYTDLARGYAQYAAQVAELVRVAAQARMEESSSSSSSAADAALVQLVGQLGQRPSNGASKA